MSAVPNDFNRPMVVPAAFPRDIVTVHSLFREYAESIGIDLCFQDFETELAALPGAYAPPNGCVLLARIGDQAAGCIALRPMSPDAGELKRLYVRPEFRRRGCGRALVARALEEARRIGYRTARLDTLREMRYAIELYRAFGFEEVPPFRRGEPEEICYFEMPLRGTPC